MMKKFLLFGTFILGAFNFSNATINLFDRESGLAVTNGTVIQMWGDVNEYEITFHNIGAINNTGNTTKINMKRYVLNSQTGVSDYFCWYVCLSPVTTASTPLLSHSVGACYNSNQGDSITYFSSYYRPNSTLGSSTFRYVWYDSSAPNDSAYVDITYNVTPLSIKENVNPSISISPNPANQNVNISLENVNINADARLDIFNLIGEKVYSEKLTSLTNRLNVAEFDNGVYLVTILNDKKAIITKRLVVNH